MIRVIALSVLSLIRITTFGQDKDSIFSHPEISPSFPGGYDSLKKFIAKNLKYPQGNIDSEGLVYIQFTVNEDGTLTDTNVLKGLCEACNKNALEVFSIMPKWIPGKIDDKPVKTRMVFPIRFTTGGE